MHQFIVAWLAFIVLMLESFIDPDVMDDLSIIKVLRNNTGNNAVIVRLSAGLWHILCTSYHGCDDDAMIIAT